MIRARIWLVRRAEAGLALAEKAAALRPDSARIQMMHGWAHCQRHFYTAENDDDALAAFRRAIAIAPSGDAWAAIAQVLMSRGDVEGAKSAYREALKVDPANDWARGGLMFLEPSPLRRP